jgi:hypothetical protein
MMKWKVAFATVLAAFMLGATPAWADSGAPKFPDRLTIQQGNDYAVIWADEAKDAKVCDKEGDGRAVYLWVEWEDGGAEMSWYDNNGSKPGCSAANVSDHGSPAAATEMAVCEVWLGADLCNYWEP